LFYFDGLLIRRIFRKDSTFWPKQPPRETSVDVKKVKKGAKTTKTLTASCVNQRKRSNFAADFGKAEASHRRTPATIKDGRRRQNDVNDQQTNLINNNNVS